jgi:hypothetical protein
LHVSGVPAWQLPFARHNSAPLQALLSLHELLVSGVNTQPVAGLHESSVQGLLSLQVTAVPGWQEPLAHTSPVVHALLSVHVAVLFTPQVPLPLHTSLVQGLPSAVHAVPAAEKQLSAASLQEFRH